MNGRKASEEGTPKPGQRSATRGEKEPPATAFSPEAGTIHVVVLPNPLDPNAIRAAHAVNAAGETSVNRKNATPAQEGVFPYESDSLGATYLPEVTGEEGMEGGAALLSRRAGKQLVCRRVLSSEVLVFALEKKVRAVSVDQEGTKVYMIDPKTAPCAVDQLLGCRYPFGDFI